MVDRMDGMEVLLRHKRKKYIYGTSDPKLPSPSIKKPKQNRKRNLRVRLGQKLKGKGFSFAARPITKGKCELVADFG